MTVSILLVLCNHFFRIWLAHIVDMLGVMEESQENTEIMRRHETYGMFWLLREGSTEEKQTPRQPTRNCSNRSPSYRSVNGGK